MRNFLLIVLSILFVASCGGKKEGTEVIATVNGEKITMNDLKAKYPELDKQLENLDKQAFKYKKYYLSEMVENKLIELEAKKQGIQVAELLKKEVSGKIKPITEEDIKKFVEERNIPKDKVNELRDRIKQYLDSQNEGAVRKTFANQLKKNYTVKLALVDETEPKVDVKTSSADPVIGDKNAQLTVIEFSEFECPYCKRAALTFKKIMDEYKGKIKLVFKNYPLPFHQNAIPAANAAACAHDQGKFEEYYNTLFENNQALAMSDLIGYAKKLELDVKKFEECVKSNSKKSKIDADIEQGKKLGLTGVPVFIIKGQKHVGALSYEQFKEIIEDALND